MRSLITNIPSASGYGSTSAYKAINIKNLRYLYTATALTGLAIAAKSYASTFMTAVKSLWEKRIAAAVQTQQQGPVVEDLEEQALVPVQQGLEEVTHDPRMEQLADLIAQRLPQGSFNNQQPIIFFQQPPQGQAVQQHVKPTAQQIQINHYQNGEKKLSLKQRLTPSATTIRSGIELSAKATIAALPFLEKAGFFNNPTVQKFMPLAPYIGRLGAKIGEMQNSVGVLAFLAAAPHMFGVLTNLSFNGGYKTVSSATKRAADLINPAGLVQFAHKLSERPDIIEQFDVTSGKVVFEALKPYFIKLNSPSNTVQVQAAFMVAKILWSSMTANNTTVGKGMYATTEFINFVNAVNNS